LLVGNPNVGKSVIFSYLTGTYTIVSNYPGTTVEISSGPAGFNQRIEVIDTPGINSLYPKSEDEKVAREYLMRYRDATVVQVADAKNMFRALLLTAQLAGLGCRIILVLNMMDEARQRGIRIDTDALSASLGIPIIKTVAVEKEGLARLVQLINSGAAAPPAVPIGYPGPLAGALREVFGEGNPLASADDFFKLTALSGDRTFLIEHAGLGEADNQAIARRIDAMEARLHNPLSYYISAAYREAAERVMLTAMVVRRNGALVGKVGARAYQPAASIAAVTILLYLFVGRDWLAAAGLHPSLLVLLGVVLGVTMLGVRRVNALTLHPVGGLVVLAIVLYLIYQFVGVFAARTIVELLEKRLFGDVIIPAVSGVLPDGWIRDFIVGDFGLISVGVNYAISIVLPIVAVFFIVFGILEDTGYFPRLTVLTNNLFRLVGVNGKATLPIVLGFGCVTMAVLASRILESRKERLIVVTLLSLAIPCSAQLGIIMALSSAISLRAVALLGVIIGAEFLAVGRLLSRFLPGSVSDFILELPPLRSPKPRNIVLKTRARVKWFLKEALPYFLLATVVLFVLDASGGLGLLYRAAEPVVRRFLGLPVETVGIFIVGFFRRDYGAAGLFKLWTDGILAGNDVVVALVVISLFMPCLATLIVTIKELGLRYGISILFFVLTLSVLSGGILKIVLTGLGIQL
jgi:ferrous iron transport protein B